MAKKASLTIFGAKAKIDMPQDAQETAILDAHFARFAGHWRDDLGLTREEFVAQRLLREIVDVAKHRSVVDRLTTQDAIRAQVDTEFAGITVAKDL